MSIIEKGKPFDHVMAEFMHDEYVKLSKIFSNEVDKKHDVPFDELPDATMKTWIVFAHNVISKIMGTKT